MASIGDEEKSRRPSTIQNSNSLDVEPLRVSLADEDTRPITPPIVKEIDTISGRYWWVILLLWQLLAVLIAATGTFAAFLSNACMNSPALQTLPVYFLFGVSYCVYVFLWTRRRHLSIRWYWYIIVAFLDVEANYLVVRAYQKTNLVSVQLLDCFAIPCVMIICRVCLHVIYSVWQLVGSLVAILGLALLVTADAVSNSGNNGSSSSNPCGGSSSTLTLSDHIIGDVMVLAGAFLYACSNVTQEYLVKTHDRSEYLAMLGLWGFVISSIQTLSLEYDSIRQVPWSWSIGGYWIGFTLCMLLLYNGIPLLLQRSTATVMNVSFLMADFYAILIGLFLFQLSFNVLYIVAFVIIIIGLLLYHETPRLFWGSKAKSIAPSSSEDAHEKLIT